jgi:folate-binding protein YgfZ
MINGSFKLLEYFKEQNIESRDYYGVSAIPFYSSVEEELEVLHYGAALRIMFNYSLIELRGKDSLDFLHRITTNSVKDLKKEGVTQTIFTTEKGRILSVSTILNFDTHQFLVVGVSNKERVLGWINKYVIADDVKAEDAGERFNLLELSGPQSSSFMTLITGSSINDITPNSFKVFNAEGILFFLVKIVDFSGRDKYWILADDDNSIKLLKFMKENHGIFNFGLVGEEAYHEYRVGLGVPAAPNELNDLYNPHEARLVHLIDFKKGCYIGQEVIARLDTYDKVQKSLTGIHFEEPIESDQHFILLDNDENEVGLVTSAVNSRKLNKSIGLAYIRKNYLQPGTVLIARNNEKVTKATVQELPFKK